MNYYLGIIVHDKRRVVHTFKDYRRLASWTDNGTYVLLQCKRDGSLWMTNNYACHLGFVPNTNEVYFRAILTSATLKEINNG